MTLQLGYWNLRGFFEPIVLLLEYLEKPYETKRYSTFEEWFQGGKLEMAKDWEFPNLPWMVDGDFKLWQSSVILKYLGRQGGLFGCENIQETATQEALFETVIDMRLQFVLLCYTKGDFEDEKKESLEKIPKTLALFEARLASRKFLTGDNLYIGDFVLWSVLDYHEVLEPTVLENFPNIARFKKNFSEVPQIARFLDSDQFKRLPITLIGVAAWGGQSE